MSGLNTRRSGKPRSAGSPACEHPEEGRVKGDAIPESLVNEKRSAPITAEFCTQRYDGRRCMLVRGHLGEHEAICTHETRRWVVEGEGS